MDIPSKENSWRTVYQLISLCLAVVFAVVGLIFFFIPQYVMLFFNTLSIHLGFPEAPIQGFGLYQVLAVAYMYLVTLLAFFMYRYPAQPSFPFLLMQGKAASSFLSFVLYFVHWPLLLLLTNGIVDGLLAFGVFILYRTCKGMQQ